MQPMQPHAPAALAGLAVSDEQQADAAGTAAEAAVEAAAGGPPASEARSRQQTLLSTTRSPVSAATGTNEASPVDAHEDDKDDKDGKVDKDNKAPRNPRITDDVGGTDDAQPQVASPSARPATAMSSSASLQSLAVAPTSPDNSASWTNSASSALLLVTPSSQPPAMNPLTQLRASPLREGTLVLALSSSRSSRLPKSPQSPQHCASHFPAVPSSLDDLPNEVLMHILGYLDVNDLLATSRTSHHLRCLAVAPILHTLRRRQIRAALPPLLSSPMRPSLADLIRRHIFLTSTTVVSRKLTRSLVSIRLSRRLAARPPVHVLVERCVLPPECAPGIGHVAPALAARTRAVEREKLKDGLRRWVGAVWQREVGRRSERIRKYDESLGVGKVWRLRKFWERVSHGNGSEA
ncbi:hypothetical protein SCUCBS95973_007086 [Sporothrix curviconia]|uniref:F-box domain-containing protein n=1 Tax=Sporothrix curviconia TaxID=1260050 RepID=A0ABP0CC57_9PEZI